MTDKELPVLTAKDVGRILGEYRPPPGPRAKSQEPNTKPLTAKTVSQYLVESKEGGRYAAHPFPRPAGRVGQWPYWLPAQESAIREWAQARLGAGRRTDLSPS